MFDMNVNSIRGHLNNIVVNLFLRLALMLVVVNTEA